MELTFHPENMERANAFKSLIVRVARALFRADPQSFIGRLSGVFLTTNGQFMRNPACFAANGSPERV
jgi:hypothetical protein